MTSPAPGHGPQAGPCVGWGAEGWGGRYRGTRGGKKRGHDAARRDEGSATPNLTCPQAREVPGCTQHSGLCDGAGVGKGCLREGEWGGDHVSISEGAAVFKGRLCRCLASPPDLGMVPPRRKAAAFISLRLQHLTH